MLKVDEGKFEYFCVFLLWFVLVIVVVSGPLTCYLVETNQPQTTLFCLCCLVNVVIFGRNQQFGTAEM